MSSSMVWSKLCWNWLKETCCCQASRSVMRTVHNYCLKFEAALTAGQAKIENHGRGNKYSEDWGILVSRLRPRQGATKLRYAPTFDGLFILKHFLARRTPRREQKPS